MTDNNIATPYHMTLVKCVDVKRVRDWVSQEKRRRVDLTEAWKIIKVQYCAALVGRGVCPVECDNCREAIISMFDLEEAKNPEALLTWMAKDRSAQEIERLIAAQKTERARKFPTQETHPVDALFHHPDKPTNLFLDLIGDYR